MQFIRLIGIGVLTFIATNIYDYFLLIIFFLNPRYKKFNVIMGQYIGILTIILICFASYFFRLIIPIKIIGILGFIPIITGINNLVNLKKHNRSNSEKTDIPIKETNSTLAQISFVAILTLSNGCDNISIYLPLFLSVSLHDIFILIIIFALMIGIWCSIAYYTINNNIMKKFVNKYGHIISSIVLIVLGVYILISCRTLTLFTI